MQRKNQLFAFFLVFGIVILLLSFRISQTEISESAAPAVEMKSAEAPLDSTVNLSSKNRLQIVSPRIAKDKVSRALENVKLKNRLPTQTTVQPARLEAHTILAGSRWKIWPDARIATDHSPEVVLTRVSNMDIVKNESIKSTVDVFDLKNPIVLYDLRLQKAGVLTGVIIVQTSDPSALTRDLASLNAEVVHAFDPIQTYFVTSMAPRFDLQDLYHRIKNLRHVQSAELEILSKNFEKN